MNERTREKLLLDKTNVGKKKEEERERERGRWSFKRGLKVPIQARNIFRYVWILNETA